MKTLNNLPSPSKFRQRVLLASQANKASRRCLVAARPRRGVDARRVVLHRIGVTLRAVDGLRRRFVRSGRGHVGMAIRALQGPMDRVFELFSIDLIVAGEAVFVRQLLRRCNSAGSGNDENRNKSTHEATVGCAVGLL